MDRLAYKNSPAKAMRVKPKPYEVVLELTDGQQIKTVLSRPFDPGQKVLEAGSESSGGKQLFSIEDICCLTLKREDAHVEFSEDEEEHLIEVEISSLKTFNIRVTSQVKSPYGFYGISIGDTASSELIFFYFHGVRSRRNFHPLGEILKQNGVVSRPAIDNTLLEQQRLRKRKVGEILAEQNNLDQEAIEEAIRQASTSEQELSDKMVGDILVSAKLVTREQVAKALKTQRDNRHKKLGTLFQELDLVSEEEILAALAYKFHMRQIDLRQIVPSEEALAALPLKLVYKMQIIPVEDHGHRLVVATSNPTDPGIGDTLRFYTGRQIELVVAPSAQIAEAIDKYYIKVGDLVDDLIGEMAEEESASNEDLDITYLDESDSQIIQLVNRILIEAYKKGVSDIHVEPGMGKRPTIVRYRVDGICHQRQNIPYNYSRAFISRLKVMARLDIAERRRPQSGKLLLMHDNKQVEFRMEITPTIGSNEDVVLRVLSGYKSPILGDMGFMDENLAKFKSILSKPYGIILCVGPTGSGKTYTLHAGLNHINTGERKIWTAEDPVEITQEGLRQVQVQPKIGYTFQEALRSFLRADPDVIMVGEMRDLETAKIAVDASLTGHLVLSTLHTNSAPETVVRLIEIGIDPINFADALLGIIAQRLTRIFCKECKASFHPDQHEYQQLVDSYDPVWWQKHNMPEYTADFRLMKSSGCGKCEDIKYQGRIAIHELMLGTRDLKRAIKGNVSAEDLQELAINEGMRTLRMDGIAKVLEGITDLEQILKVCL